MAAVVKLYPSEEPRDVEMFFEAQMWEIERDHKKRKQLAESMSLKRLAAQDEDLLIAARGQAWLDAHGLAPLSQEEFEIWRDWLPTSYWSNVYASSDRAWYDAFSLEQYAYKEGIPLEVRKLMQEVRGKFTALEVRTPEKHVRRVDPILLGHIIDPRTRKRSVYLLARWAEFAKNLISFKEVEFIVRARRWVERGNFLGLTSNKMGLVLGAAVAGTGMAMGIALIIGEVFELKGSVIPPLIATLPAAVLLTNLISWFSVRMHRRRQVHKHCDPALAEQILG